MNFEQLAKTRQSCRKYSNRAVEKEKLEKIAEIARLAPSACNTQPWKMHFITDPEKVVEFSKMFELNKMDSFYSDSLSDLPIMKKAKKAYLVDGDTITEIDAKNYN